MRRPVSAPAPVLVLGAIASVQFGAAIAVRLFPDAGPGGTVLLRIGISALLLLALARPSVRHHDAASLGWAAAYGLVLAAMNMTFYQSLARIPLGVAVTIEFVGPLAVAVLGSRRPVDFLWAGLAAVGVVLLTSVGGHVDAVGVLWALAAGAFWGLYIVLAQRVGRVLPGATGLAFGLVAGTVALLPFGIASGGGRLLHADVVLRGAAVAVLSSALPYSLELFALRRMRSRVFGVLMSLEPAMAALSGLLFLGQHLHLHEWLAICCVVAASVGATLGARRDELPVEPGATPNEVLVA
jgi:inner membrane transporter RhtA